MLSPPLLYFQSSSTVMARKPSFPEEVERKLRRGENYQDVDHFAQQIGLYMHAHKEEAVHLLSRMVSMVKGKRDSESTSRGRKTQRDWLV